MQAYSMRTLNRIIIYFTINHYRTTSDTTRLTFNKICISVNRLIRLVTYNTFYMRMALFHRITLQPANPYLEYQLQFKSISVKNIKIDSTHYVYIKKRSEFESTYFVGLIIDFRK